MPTLLNCLSASPDFPMVNLETPTTEVVTPKNRLSLIYRDVDQTLPQKLLQPLNIAIVASAVLHGVIGYGAPSLPFFQQPAIPKEVKIMQLTSQEQSRIRRDVPPLPPAVTGVPIPNAPGQGRTVNPGFSGNFPNNNFNNSSRASGFSNFVPDDGTTFVPRNPRQFGGPFGSGVPQYTFPVNPGTTPQDQPPVRVLPRETPAPNTPGRTWEQFTTSQNFSTGGRSILSSPFTRPSPTATSTPTATPTPATTPTGGNPDNTAGNTTPSPSPVPTTTPGTAGTAGNDNGNPGTGGNPNSGGNNNGTPGSVTPNPLLAFNPDRTGLTPDGQNTEFLGFVGVGDEQLLQPDKQVKLTLEVKYPLAACVLKLEKPVTAILGVITNQDGTINKGPDILQSSGYEIFNQAAKDAVLKYDQFTPAKAYLFTVPFAYSPEACAEAGSIAPVPSP
jgi:hypothetical protein